MSTTMALAAVTAVMKYLLVRSQAQYGVRDFIGGALTVSTVAPDRVPDDQLRLNLFLFRAIPNLGWMPNDQPSRGPDGERTANPYLPLDLHYVITAHGLTDFQNEVLLGYAMQVFHEHPVLARGVIREALRIPSSTDPPNPLLTGDTTPQVLTALAAAGLADQIEQVKLAPYRASLEETSHAWSALQTSYRPTGLYMASVVLIRSSRPARQASPVRKPVLYAYPFKHPVIEAVAATGDGIVPIVAGSEVEVVGQALRGTHTRVAVGSTELTPDDPEASMVVSDSRIRFRLPAALRAGLQSLQVRHRIELGSPPTLRGGTESNVAAFVLQPQILKNESGEYAVTVVAASGTAPRLLRVTAIPDIAPEQRVVVLLNEVGIAAGAQPHAYSVDASPRAAGSPATPTVEFAITGVADGAYIVRLQVDGAESPLDFDETAGGYSGPRVSL